MDANMPLAHVITWVGRTVLLAWLWASLSACDSGADSPGASPIDATLPKNDRPGAPTLNPGSGLDQAGMTVRISINANGEQADQRSTYSSVSRNGQIVVFDSYASNLIPSDVGNNIGLNWHVYAKQRLDGSIHQLSVAIEGGSANGKSTEPRISADGHFVVFTSAASNLVAGDTNLQDDVFVRDLLRSVTSRVSVGSAGQQADGTSEKPDISADGRYIVFQSSATNLSTLDDNSEWDVYVYDRETSQTRLLSINPSQTVGNGASTEAKITPDGSHVVFSSLADNLVAADTNTVKDVFVVNTLTGHIQRVSRNTQGEQANKASDSGSVNAEGTLIAFRSEATNLSTIPTGNQPQVYLRDRVQNTTELVSISNAGVAANKSIFSGTVMSADGRFVGFYTSADNLHIEDNNNAWDVYLRDRLDANTRLVSVNSAGRPGDGSSFVPAMSETGQYISFGSNATSLVADDTNNTWDVFLHVLEPHNFPPLASAGADQFHYLGASVRLDGSQSSDPDAGPSGPGPVKAYQWTLVAKPASSQVSLIDLTTAIQTFNPDVVGDYVFELVVNDGVQDSVSDSVVVTVAEDLAPTAVITLTSDNGEAPLNVTVSGWDSTDPEAAALTYHWDFGDAGSAQNSSEQVTASHLYQNPGNYQIVLTVTDPVGNQDQAFVTLVVRHANHVPQLHPSASTQSGVAPLTVQFAANAADPDQDPLRFQWSFGDNSPFSLERDPLHIFQTPGIYTVNLTVSDGDSEQSAALTIAVNSALEFKVRKLALRFESEHKVDGSVRLELELPNPPQLASDQPVRLSLDQLELFSTTAGELYAAANRNHRDTAAEGNRRSQRLSIVWDTEHGRLRVSRTKLLLGPSLDLHNGVDVVLQFGATRAVQNVILEPVVQHRPCQGKGLWLETTNSRHSADTHHADANAPMDCHTLSRRYFYPSAKPMQHPQGVRGQ